MRAPFILQAEVDIVYVNFVCLLIKPINYILVLILKLCKLGRQVIQFRIYKLLLFLLPATQRYCSQLPTHSGWVHATQQSERDRIRFTFQLNK